MCVYNDAAETEKLRARKKPIAAWKVLERDGRTVFVWGSEPYGPGTNCAKGIKYKTCYLAGYPHGLHVYRNKRLARLYHATGGYNFVRVFVNPADVIAADGSEIAATRLHIDFGDWLAAGFPRRVVRRRYI